MGMFLFAGIILLAVIGFVVGVRWGVAAKDSDLVGSSQLKTRGLHYLLKMEKTTYALGEPIDVQLSVTNVTSAPITLVFAKNLEFEIWVRKEVDLLFAQVPKTMWRLSEDQMVYKDRHTVRIEPGKSITFSGTWDQIGRENKNVSPGQYQIIGSLLAEGRTESLQLQGKTSD